MYTHLESATTAPLHQIADVFRLNARPNERLYIVVVKFLQLRTYNTRNGTNMYGKVNRATRNGDNVKLYYVT